MRAHHRVVRVGEHEDEVHDTRRGDVARALSGTVSKFPCAFGRRALTAFSRISAGDDGGGVLNSKGKSAAFRQFLIRGASWRFPSVFCKEGTGW